MPKAVRNEYGTFSSVFHKMFQCWADRPVCFLDEVSTDAEISSASHRMVTEVLLTHSCHTQQWWQMLITFVTHLNSFPSINFP